MTTASSIICIVDDDEAVRDSLEALFLAEALPVAVFPSAGAFLRDRPSEIACVVTDVRMPDMSGLGLLATLARGTDSPPVILITGHGDVPMAVRAMKLGAVDFIEKPFDANLLLTRVRDAIRADRDAADSASTVRTEIERRLATLTPREREVLEQLVIGLSNKAIGLELKISPRTVEIHRARVMDKMDAGSLSELVRLALAAGVDPNPI